MTHFSSQISYKYQIALTLNINKRIVGTKMNDCLSQNLNKMCICAQEEL